jgi:Putative transposase
MPGFPMQPFSCLSVDFSAVDSRVFEVPQFGEVKSAPGPRAVLAFCRATPTVSLIAFDGRQVTFKVKDYRVEGPGRYTTMTLDVGEFIRRFLIHVLPKGFHHSRHYGLFAGSNRAEITETVREFLNLDPPAAEDTAAEEIGGTDPAQPLAHASPLLWRPHVRHRGVRARPPAASSANRTLSSQSGSTLHDREHNPSHHRARLAPVFDRQRCRATCWPSGTA